MVSATIAPSIRRVLLILMSVVSSATASHAENGLFANNARTAVLVGGKIACTDTTYR